MQSRTALLFALTFTLGVDFGINTAAAAADLPKEGTYSVTFSAFGTFKSTSVGKDVVLFSFDESGPIVGNGLLDHMTWHSWGLFNITNGIALTPIAYWVLTDPNGDQLAGIFSGDKWPKDAKSFTGSATWITGTGKYAGISGNVKVECHGPEFRTAAEGTYVQYCTVRGGYKLP
jgi:hypothetical protein